jgi:hypothetical protein
MENLRLSCLQTSDRLPKSEIKLAEAEDKECLLSAQAKKRAELTPQPSRGAYSSLGDKRFGCFLQPFLNH